MMTKVKNFAAPTTISLATETNYRKRYRQLLKQCEREYGESGVTGEILADWLCRRRNNYSMSTWRQYKSAILFVLKTDSPELAEAIVRLAMQFSNGLLVHSKRTSGAKTKSVPSEFWQNLQNTLVKRSENSHLHSNGLLNVLKATLLTGLRPIEWSYATLHLKTEDNQLVLRVKNAKFSAKRANGEYREMYINKLIGIELKSILEAIRYCNLSEEKIGTRLTALQNEFANARAKLDMKSGLNERSFTVTMYSFRHQFLADAKKNHVDKKNIAALAGHKSVHTATKHYGRRSSGRNLLLVRPTIESVNAVSKIDNKIVNKLSQKTDVCPNLMNALGFD